MATIQDPQYLAALNKIDRLTARVERLEHERVMIDQYVPAKKLWEATDRIAELEDLVKRSNKASKLEDLQRIAELERELEHKAECDLHESYTLPAMLGRAEDKIAELEQENKMLQRIADNADKVGRELREQLANEKHTHQITKNTERDLAKQLAEANHAVEVYAMRAATSEDVCECRRQTIAELERERDRLRERLARMTFWGEDAVEWMKMVGEAMRHGGATESAIDDNGMQYMTLVERERRKMLATYPGEEE